MKITNDRLEITESNVINWADVYAVHLSNDRLVLILENQEVELSQLSPLMVDRLFRTYESYLKEHPEMKKKKRSKSRKKPSSD